MIESVLKSKIAMACIRYAALLTAVIFIVIGILREEHLMVLKKAVKICLECIGVG